jgi:hypothetical protein
MSASQYYGTPAQTQTNGYPPPPAQYYQQGSNATWDSQQTMPPGGSALPVGVPYNPQDVNGGGPAPQYDW